MHNLGLILAVPILMARASIMFRLTGSGKSELLQGSSIFDGSAFMCVRACVRVSLSVCLSVSNN
jgi:hypothetical protein